MSAATIIGVIFTVIFATFFSWLVLEWLRRLGWRYSNLFFFVGRPASLFGFTLYGFWLCDVPLDWAATLGSAGVMALGFAGRKIVQDFVIGVRINVTDYINEGEWIEVDGIGGIGEIVHVGRIEAVIHYPDGRHLLIPLSSIGNRPVVNRSKSDFHRVDVVVWVDISKIQIGGISRVTRVIFRACKACPRRIREHGFAPRVVCTGHYGDATRFLCSVWVSDHHYLKQTAHNLYRLIHRAFVEQKDLSLRRPVPFAQEDMMGILLKSSKD